MSDQLPSWPATRPSYGLVVLRELSDDDTHLAVELAEDPYVPLIGSLPADPATQQALEHELDPRGDDIRILCAQHARLWWPDGIGQAVPSHLRLHRT